ncbi:MAG: SpoIIE family protein phosphatase [Planctomycetota bacterium]|jgi:serine phosphatase RsbU (regulator of sigma subunit)|nr:SpoIIE family protein phosphatase [Planctomycetota bacterium]
MAANMSLADVAGALVGHASSRALLERLEELLTLLGASPGRLHLIDSESMTFYPVAGFGCPAEGPELEAQQELIEPPPGHRVLFHNGDPIGLLTFDPDGDSPAMSQLVDLLGPVLVGVQQQEISLDELRSLHEQMAHLVSAGQLLGQLDVDVLLVEVLQLAMKAVGAEVGAILTPNDAGTLELQVTWGLRDDHVMAIRTAEGEPVVQAVFAAEKQRCVVGEAVASELDCSALDAVLTGVMVLPLATGGRKQGALLLANPEQDFDADTQRLAETVCGMAAIAIDNALLVQSMVERERLGRELDIARKVQADMFPVSPLDEAGIHIEGRVRSCDETGGDYYGYLAREGRAVAMIADVTGHGLGAALFTTVAHAIIQQQLHAGVGLLPSLQVLNQGLTHTGSGRFLTAFVCEIDPATKRCTYFSAGHNSILWIHQGEVRWVESLGMPLGILPSYMGDEEAELQLAAGDLLLLYTDGFTEAIDDARQCYGEDRLAETVLASRAAGRTGAELIDDIFVSVDAWTRGQEQADDLTLVLVELADE